MTTLLRLLAILALLAVALLVWAAAAAVTIHLAALPIDVGAIVGAEAPEAINEAIAAVSWPEAALWWGGGLFFLISAIRLMRGTQGWFLWLLGFACFVGRWTLSEGGPQAALDVVKGVDASAYLKPAELLGDVTVPEVQVARFGALLLLGLIVFIVDLADRAHWKRQEG